MIEHLRGRELALEPLGWTGREAEWIALVCLHSGVFTQPQYSDFYGIHRKASWRIVNTLVERKEAQVIRYFTPAEGGAACWIKSKSIYRALGVENIRHRREVSRPLLIRRLLALDYVIEHPGLNWLPGEGEKVQYLTELGLARSLVPRRIYFGAVGAQKRYFALKLPLALDPDAATFAYIDPGHATDNELRSWGAAHVRLWEALRKTGRRVRVIGIAAAAHIERAERVLKVWSATAPQEGRQGMTLQQEMKLIGEAMDHDDNEVLGRYGGFNGALQRLAALQKMPEARVTEGVSIDEFSTYRATRFSAKNGGA